MRSKFTKYILGIVLFYILWIGVLPIVITKSVDVVCKKLSYNSKYSILVDGFSAKLYLLPNIKFRAKSIQIKSKSDDTEVKMDNVVTKIRLLPLLSGVVHLNYIDINSVNFKTNLSGNIELDKDFFTKLENAKVYSDSVRIGNFNGNLYQKGIKKPILFNCKNFILQLKNRYFKIKFNSSLSVDENTSTAGVNLFIPRNNDLKRTIFEVDVTNFDIAPLRMYFKHFLPDDLVELKGVINVHANKGELITELDKCAAIMKEPDQSLIFPEKMTIKSKFNIRRQNIRFEYIDINSANIHTLVKGRISDYFGKSMPTIDINIVLNDSKIEDIVSLLPPFSVEEMNVSKLKKYKFYGDIIGNLSIKGRLPEPDVVGDVFVQNGILTKPIPKAKAGAIVKLDFTGKYVNFDVDVSAGNSEKVSVKGNSEIYNIKYADVSVRTTDNVDLHVAEEVVNPLHEILNFVVGPVPIMDIHGNGNLNIDVKGNRKISHVWGTMNMPNVSASFNGMPDVVVKNANAKINFNDLDAVFTMKNGKVNGKDFNINGTCNMSGKFNFNVDSKDQPTDKLYRALQSSTLVPDIQKMLPVVDDIKGLMDLKLNIFGNVKYIEDLKVNKNAFVKGDFKIKNNNLIFQGTRITSANGNIKFDSNIVDADLNGKLNNSVLLIKAKIKDEIGDILLDIPTFNPNYLLENSKICKKGVLPIISLSARYKGDINNVDYNSVNLNVKILNSIQNSDIKYNGGEVVVSNGNVNIKNLSGYIKNNSNKFEANLKINGAFDKKPETTGFVKINTPNLQFLNQFNFTEILPQNISKYIQDYEFQNGALNLYCKINKNKINSSADLNGIKLIYIPLELPINIINGNLTVKDNVLYLNKINVLADRMPILLDGNIRDILKKHHFDLYINSKPQQEFIDKYINKKQIYPIKIKGDIVCWAKLKGTLDNYDLKANINLSKDSSFYHYGATVGDIENEISMFLNTKVIEKNNLKIKEFSYDKIIESLNGKKTQLNLLKSMGNITIVKDDFIFDNFKVKTTNPTDARIFNILFRKPNIKQGLFTSDLKFNGKLSNPHVLGDFHIFETNIPFLDTTLKNIELVFKERTIDLNSKGDVMGNNVTISGVLKNKLSAPYRVEKATIYTNNLNLNNISEKINLVQVERENPVETLENFDPKSLILDNIKLKADKVILRNIHATNFNATGKLNKEGLLNVENFVFDIANGQLNGNYKYNLRNNDMSFKLNANDISANDITIALFDLDNQIYGDLTGEIEVKCNGSDFEQCMQTLTGSTIFNVKNGRMPKLGSLEYLLKAGNLVKGGLTGVSINGIIDLITPLKTGEFSDIDGDIRMKDGVARDIEIVTKGKDLSLYLMGTYNFSTSVADMEVLGLLSRKISTMFGPVGNMSINTLFNIIPGVDLSKDSKILTKINKLPGIELSNHAYRRFIAEIKGNINGSNYVTSFSWVN